jgi:hypothetical protein
LLDAEDAWSLFVDAVRDNAPGGRTITVTHRDLLADPRRTLTNILGALGLLCEA